MSACASRVNADRCIAWARSKAVAGVAGVAGVVGVLELVLQAVVSTARKTTRPALSVGRELSL